MCICKVAVIFLYIFSNFWALNFDPIRMLLFRRWQAAWIAVGYRCLCISYEGNLPSGVARGIGMCEHSFLWNRKKDLYALHPRFPPYVSANLMAK